MWAFPGGYMEKQWELIRLQLQWVSPTPFSTSSFGALGWRPDQKTVPKVFFEKPGPKKKRFRVCFLQNCSMPKVKLARNDDHIFWGLYFGKVLELVTRWHESFCFPVKLCKLLSFLNLNVSGIRGRFPYLLDHHLGWPTGGLVVPYLGCGPIPVTKVYRDSLLGGAHIQPTPLDTNATLGLSTNGERLPNIIDPFGQQLKNAWEKMQINLLLQWTKKDFQMSFTRILQQILAPDLVAFSVERERERDVKLTVAMLRHFSLLINVRLKACVGPKGLSSRMQLNNCWYLTCRLG